MCSQRFQASKRHQKPHIGAKICQTSRQPAQRDLKLVVNRHVCCANQSEAENAKCVTFDPVSNLFTFRALVSRTKKKTHTQILSKRSSKLGFQRPSVSLQNGHPQDRRAGSMLFYNIWCYRGRRRQINQSTTWKVQNYFRSYINPEKKIKSSEASGTYV
jgi:hypothetical protein